MKKNKKAQMLELLEAFSLHENVNAITVNALAEILLAQKHIFDGQENPSKVRALRSIITFFYNNEQFNNIFYRDKDFKKLLCFILVTLAKLYPTNKVNSQTNALLDTVTSLPIKNKDRFYSITGQIFSIDQVISFNKERVYDRSLGESVDGKYLLNPQTNKPFMAIDTERFLIIAGKKKKDLSFIIDVPNIKQEGYGELTQEFSLKDLVLMTKGIDKAVTLNLSKEFKISDQDALACMIMSTKNNEKKSFEYLFQYLGINLISKLTPTMAENHVIQEEAARAMICLASFLNEPKNLRQIADLSLAGGFHVNPRFSLGLTALHMAAQEGSVEAVQVLLDPKYKLDIDVRNSAGATPLGMAASSRQLNVVKLLAEKGANLMIARFDGEAPIHTAAEHNDSELMQFLIESKVNLNQKTGPLCFTKTAAHLAAQHNSKQAMKLLIEAGADLTKTNEEGFTPLMLAAYYGSKEVMELLLAHPDKAPVDQIYRGKLPHTLSSIAAERGHTEILRLLADAKIDLSMPRKDDGTTPLHRAVLNRHHAAAAFLIDLYLKNGNDIFQKHKGHQSAFLFAFANKDWKMANLFLNKVKYEDIPLEDQVLVMTYKEFLTLPKDQAISVTNNKMVLFKRPVAEQSDSVEQTATIEKTLNFK